LHIPKTKSLAQDRVQEPFGVFSFDSNYNIPEKPEPHGGAGPPPSGSHEEADGPDGTVDHGFFPAEGCQVQVDAINDHLSSGKTDPDSLRPIFQDSLVIFDCQVVVAGDAHAGKIQGDFLGQTK
jgi:hypothetical protein